VAASLRKRGLALLDQASRRRSIATSTEFAEVLSFLFKRRDKSTYPDDEFGDELYRSYPKPGAIPPQALLWFDIYFEKELDSDLMAKEFANRRFEINRDYDEEPNDGFGRWNIDVEHRITPSYREIKANVEQMRDRLRSRGGKLASWLLMPAE